MLITAIDLTLSIFIEVEILALWPLRQEQVETAERRHTNRLRLMLSQEETNLALGTSHLPSQGDNIEACLTTRGSLCTRRLYELVDRSDKVGGKEERRKDSHGRGGNRRKRW